MKSLIIAILTSILLVFSNPAKAQDTPAQSHDTLYVNYLEGLSKGDILPFNFVYQRAKIWKDTIITCAYSKDISIEVLENDNENHFIRLSVVQDNYKKFGPEANNPEYMGSTSLLGDGYPIEIVVDYNGDMAGIGYVDTLISRAIKNLDYVADTLANSSFVTEKLSREEWKNRFSQMQDTSAIMWNTVADFNDLFFFGAFDYEADSLYTKVDSVFSYSTNQMHYYGQLVGWDKSFSDNNEDLKDLYVFRSAYRIDGIPFLERN